MLLLLQTILFYYLSILLWKFSSSTMPESVECVNYIGASALYVYYMIQFAILFCYFNVALFSIESRHPLQVYNVIYRMDMLLLMGVLSKRPLHWVSFNRQIVHLGNLFAFSFHLQVKFALPINSYW